MPDGDNMVPACKSLLNVSHDMIRLSELRSHVSHSCCEYLTKEEQQDLHLLFTNALNTHIKKTNICLGLMTKSSPGTREMEPERQAAGEKTSINR